MPLSMDQDGHIPSIEQIMEEQNADIRKICALISMIIGTNEINSEIEVKFNILT